METREVVVPFPPGFTAPTPLYVHFEGEQYAAIRDLSERWGCTVEGAVRRAVETAALFVRLETAG